ncbi:fatty acid desaturase [Nocardia mexicana]|uniref:Fatty acid desaturase n=2 Tax=Nocardia mexicana TaxID=279262 RepID=A0A370GSG3_9NOCA|nr:fatty acid desaturase [Nocardia mexicana]
MDNLSGSVALRAGAPERARAAVDPPMRSDAVRGSEYAVLLRRVRQAGLLDRRVRYYGWKSAITAAAWVAGWVAFVLVGDSWWQVAVAAWQAAVFAQLAFLGHDAGHRQIFRTRWANHLYGLIAGNLGIGVSIGWWTSNHNRHHAHPNTEGEDPDVSGVLAHSGERARRGQGVRRLIFRYQAWLFFPMLLLEGWSLHGASVRGVASWNIRHRRREAVMLGAHFVGYLVLVLAVLPPVHALAFVLLHQGLFGLYMGCTFAPNHKGMAVLTAEESTDFLRRQVLTSRNVRGGWFVDTALGGLNYQIEHHLFPAMPRPALRRAQPLVVQFCAERGLPYCETGLLESYAQALGHLNTVGQSARALPPSEPDARPLVSSAKGAD